MTTKDAILKLADAVSGNTSANVATDVQALAVLAQAMTGGVPAEPLATVDDAIGYIADNYSGGGGGDYTTASVTFLNSSQQEDFQIGCANVYDGAIVQSIDWADMDGETPFDVIMYKGETYTDLPSDVAITVTAVTGDIEIYHGKAYIHGDGAVTIGDA